MGAFRPACSLRPIREISPAVLVGIGGLLTGSDLSLAGGAGRRRGPGGNPALYLNQGSIPVCSRGRKRMKTGPDRCQFAGCSGKLRRYGASETALTLLR